MENMSGGNHGKGKAQGETASKYDSMRQSQNNHQVLNEYLKNLKEHEQNKRDPAALTPSRLSRLSERQVAKEVYEVYSQKAGRSGIVPANPFANK